MLYDDPVLFFRGLTIFKDFSNPRTFYFLPPEAPRIARVAEGSETGDYALRLVVFRPDPDAPTLPQGMEDGGGFLNLDTDLYVKQALLDEVRDEIRRKFGADANLVPVPFINGSVELVLLGVSRDEEGQPFVREVAGATVPSLYGSERAAFSTVLDRHGAALMKAVIEEGGVTMAAVIYHLTYAGIPPAYNLKITIDYKRVFEHLDLRMRAGVGAGNSTTSFVAKAGFHMLMQELKETRAIKVEEVDPIPGENGRTPVNQEMINEIIGNLMGSKWFKPSLTTQPQMTDLSGLLTGGHVPASGAPASGGPATTPSTPASGAPRPASGPASGAGPASVPASGPATPPASGAPATSAARQNATWTEEANTNLGNDRGVEPFQPSASGNTETLTVKSPTGATATVDGAPTPITGGKISVEVPAGANKAVVITWPPTTEQEDTFHMFFNFDQPENDAEVDQYGAGNPQPADERFTAKSQAKSAAAPGGLASLGPWLDSLSGSRMRIRAYASYESDPTDHQHNMELSRRRSVVAQKTVDRLKAERRFTTSDKEGLGHDPAASNSVPVIPGNGDQTDNHGPKSKPAHRVALITGYKSEAREASTLRGRLSRTQAPPPSSGGPIPSGSGPIPSGSGPIPSGSGPVSGPPPPTGTGAPPPPKDPTKIEAAFEVNLEMIQQEEHVIATYELSSRKARTHEIHPQGQLVLKGIDPKKYILEADGAIEFFRWLEISASTTAQWALDGIHSIGIQLRYGPRDDGSFQWEQAMVLTPDKPTDGKKVGVLRENADRNRRVVYWYEHKVTVHYTDDVAMGTQRGAVTSVGVPGANSEGWIRTDARNLVIHPRDVTPAVTVNIATGVMQYDILEKAQLALTYGPYRQNIELSAEHPNHKLVIRPEPGLVDPELATEGTLFYKDRAQVPLPRHAWKPQELIVINEPRENILRVRVIFADPSDIYEKAIVDLRYETGTRVAEQNFELKDHAETKDWSVRLEDPNARTWRYKALLIKKSGGTEVIDWTDGRNEQLIVGVQAVDVIPVQITWLMPPPAGELLGVKIDLLYEDQPNLLRWTRSELIREGHNGTFTWSIPIRDIRKTAYRYKVTEFRATGTKEGQWTESDSTMLVLLPGS